MKTYEELFNSVLNDNRNFILNEAKQTGVIYHFTSLYNITNILKTNTIHNGRQGYISFTRNFSLPDISSYFGSGEYIVRLVIDGNKLSNKYKITPVSNSDYDDEFEEGVIGDISNLSIYILNIDILADYRYYKKETTKEYFEKLQEFDMPVKFIPRWYPYKGHK